MSPGKVQVVGMERTDMKIFFFKGLFVYSKGELQREMHTVLGRGVEHTDIASTGSLPSQKQWLGMGQSKARSLHSGVPCDWKCPRHLLPLLPPSYLH